MAKTRKALMTLSHEKPETEHKAAWITISTDEFESMKSTIEILSNPRWRAEALAGHAEALAGKGSRLEDVKRRLA